MDDEGGLVLHEAPGVVVGLRSDHYPVRLGSKRLHCVHNSSAVLRSKVVGQLGVIFKDRECCLQ